MAKKRPQLDEKEIREKYIVVDEFPSWLKFPISEKFFDSSFFRIVIFYILHSPCKESSYSRTKLENYGWINPWKSSKFRDALDEIGNYGKTNDKKVDKLSEIKETWESLDYNDEFYNIEGKEIALFVTAGESNPFFDLLHHIRNSLAHGRFTAKKYKGEYYVYMEDVKKVTANESSTIFYCVTARIILKRSTLTKWIDFLEMKTEPAKKICENMKHKQNNPSTTHQTGG